MRLPATWRVQGYFRLLFLVGLHVFLQEHVDVAILEVGLGGRLDATNIIARPVQKPLPCSFANCASVHNIDTGTGTKQGTAIAAIAAHRRIRLWSLFSKPHRWRPTPAGQSCAESPVSTTTTSRRAARQLARPRHMHAAALCL